MSTVTLLKDQIKQNIKVLKFLNKSSEPLEKFLNNAITKKTRIDTLKKLADQSNNILFLNKPKKYTIKDLKNVKSYKLENINNIINDVKKYENDIKKNYIIIATVNVYMIIEKDNNYLKYLLSEKSKAKRIYYDDDYYVLIKENFQIALNYDAKKLIENNNLIHNRLQEEKYNMLLDNLIDDLNNKVFRILLKNIDSKDHIIQFNNYYSKNIKKHNFQNLNIKQSEEKFLEDYLENDNENKMLCNEYINYDINNESKNIKDFFIGSYQSDYIINNYKKSSCLYSTIIDHFKESYDKHYKKTTLTYEYIYKICHPKSDIVPETMSEQIKNIVPFFKKYRLILKCYDIKNRLIFSYHPNSDNKEHNKGMICNINLIIHNNHVYKMNCGLKSLQQLEKIDTETETETEKILISPSTDYYIRDNINYSIFINSINEIINIDFSTIEDNNINIIYNNSLNELFDVLYYDCKYEPRIGTLPGNIIDRVTIKINDKFLHFINPDNLDNEPNYMMLNQDNFNKYSELDYKLYKSLINKTNKSFYNPNFLSIINSMMPSALNGRLKGEDYIEKGTIYEIDINKAYTSYLLKLEYLPVVSHFDNFEEYDDHEIEDYNLYIVKVEKRKMKDYYKILLPDNYNILSGMTLKQNLHKIEKIIKITHFIRFSKMIKNNSSNIIKEIYESDITTSQKKFLVNKNLGLLEKKKNSKRLTMIFGNQKEAELFRNIYGGEVYTMSKPDYSEYMIEALDWTEEQWEEYKNREPEEEKPKEKINNKVYYLIMSSESDLTNGFLPIKIFIYDMLKNDMFNLSKTVSKKYEVVGIRTDCIYIDVPKEHKQEFINIAKITNEEKEKDPFATIGKYNYISKVSQMPLNPIRMRFNTTKDFTFKTKPNIKNIELNDEYDTENINNVLEKNNNTIILGSVPGSGKTTLMMNYIKAKKGIIVTPYNALALDFKIKGFEAMTLYQITGTRLDDNMQETTGKFYDVSDVEAVIFDEVFCYKSSDLYKIKNFMESNKHIKFYATGDKNQNKPINDTTLDDYKKYYEDIIYNLFPNVITLKINKRLKNEEDKIILNNIREDVLNSTMSINQIAKKYFKIITKYEDAKGYNITYYNHTCKKINNAIHEKIIKDRENIIKVGDYKLYEGLKLICRKYLKNKYNKMYVNYTYIIDKIDDKNKIILMSDILTNEKYELDYKLIKYFNLPYSGTCHSSQGMTINTDVTIFDIGSPLITREWFWTAITRNTDIKNVYIYISDTIKDDLKLLAYKIKSKIESHKTEDTNKNREYNEEEYVDLIWTMTELKKNSSCCSICSNVIDIFYNSYELTQFSIDRIDNTKAHLKNNCRVVCLHCNVTKK